MQKIVTLFNKLFIIDINQKKSKRSIIIIDKLSIFNQKKIKTFFENINDSF